MRSSTPGCTEAELRTWLAPYYPALSDTLAARLLVYVDLLQRWNERTNLTALRTPSQIVTRHFGESLFAAQLVPGSAETLLDVGSGAGFPGLPIALAKPELRVVLAESQGKKAAFLQEALRALEVTAEVWPRRLETMPAHRRFDVVTLRAVDRAETALAFAKLRVAAGGTLLRLTIQGASLQAGTQAVKVPQSEARVVTVELLP